LKLLRFEMKNEPGRSRSGIVQGGRVYETEGGQGVAIHEAADVRPLVPVARCGSVRIFRRDLAAAPDEPTMVSGFFYTNPNSIIGPSQIVPYPTFATSLRLEPYIAAVIIGDAFQVDMDEADDLILGYSILAMLVADDVEQSPHPAAVGRRYDIASALGPVLTTPDELNDFAEEEENGRRLILEVVARINSVDMARGSTEDLPISFAQAISAASQACPLREGDIIAMGPLVDRTDSLVLSEEDDCQVSIEAMGAISIKLSPQV
jgi:2-keto-4-pentenoate hydratase/2-oxohepta-3-ene-1,7-dioic acid hydratase in catechol pathway